MSHMRIGENFEDVEVHPLAVANEVRIGLQGLICKKPPEWVRNNLRDGIFDVWSHLAPERRAVTLKRFIHVFCRKHSTTGVSVGDFIAA
eukprot:jgi/Botrbrau1/21083/Bobra.0144s0081.1